MSSSINTNLPAIFNQRTLNQSVQGLNKAFERIGSGKQINSAADDAAGLAIANRLTTQINGNSVSISNAQDGISLAQTTESALGSVTDSLQRLRELSLQSANSSLSASDRTSLQNEANQTLAEINRVTQTTSFNDVKILSQKNDFNFQVGANVGDKITVSVDNVGSVLDEQGINNISLATPAGASDAIEAIDQALSYVNDQRAQLGASQGRLESAIGNLNSNVESASASRSRIEDTDIAKQVSELTKNKILQQISVATQAQANSLPSSILNLLKS